MHCFAVCYVCVPAGEDEVILQIMLWHVRPHVETISLRFSICYTLLHQKKKKVFQGS